MIGADWSIDDVEMAYELRGVYDGWSVARLKDGRIVNRWPEGDRRHGPAQEFIELNRDRL